MTRMLWLGMDYNIFKQQEIGSHRKYSKANASIDTFVKEMSMIFIWLADHLRQGKYACFVIGNSTVHGKRIDNANLLSSIASNRGFKEVACFSRYIQTTKKAFNPTIGKIKQENILIFQRR
jgi:site-specific DNA-methyltransferase (cytosine-N4-specific)